MNTLLELAARCEAATGPDRDLDRDILSALAGRRASGPMTGDQLYTASLDAAITLVPESMRLYVDNGTLDGGSCHACVWQVRPHRLSGGCKDVATPALALCAAALRARAAATEDTLA